MSAANAYPDDNAPPYREVVRTQLLDGKNPKVAFRQ